VLATSVCVSPAAMRRVRASPEAQAARAKRAASILSVSTITF
jgi:hypothetical protein